MSEDFDMSKTAITRHIIRTMGSYTPAVFLGLYLQSSADVIAARGVLFLLPIITLSIARSRATSISDITIPHLAVVAQSSTESAEPTPAFSFISRAS